MSADLLVPLVPADVDLRDFAFLPLEGRRLLTSETWILGTSEERCAALCLLIESWVQVPAASLPDNDRILSHLSQAGPRWPKVKEHALRGWVKATDGKLYHPVLAEKAIDAWARKLAQRDRTAAARAARQQHRQQQDSGAPVAMSVTENVTGSKGQGQGEGQGQESKSASNGGARPPDAQLHLTGEPPKSNGKAPQTRDAEDVIAYLNECCGRSYPFRTPKGELTANARVVIARLAEGYTRIQCREVIALLARKWRGDVDMARYLRPETIFGPKKFSGYIGQISGQQ